MNNQKLSNLTKKYLILGWPVMAIVIALALTFFIIIPQLVNYFSTQKTINATKARTAFINSKADNLSAIDVTDYKDNLNIALAALPEDKDIPAAVSQIQATLSASKLQLNDMTFSNNSLPVDQSSSIPATLQNYQIKIDVTGTQDALIAFMGNIKNGPEIMKVISIDLSSNKPGVFDAALDLAVYYQGTPSSLGSIEQPVSPPTPEETATLTKLQNQTQSSPVYSLTGSLPARGKSDPFQWWANFFREISLEDPVGVSW